MYSNRAMNKVDKLRITITVGILTYNNGIRLDVSITTNSKTTATHIFRIFMFNDGIDLNVCGKK
jgi:hypothetical protein